MTKFSIHNAQDILDRKQSAMVTVSHDTIIKDAILSMVASKVGAILVTKDQEIVGIWTERDLLRNSLTPGFDLNSSRIETFMVSPVIGVPSDTPLLKLEEMFVGLYIRHLLVMKDGMPAGLLSIGDVMRASLLNQDKKIKELNKMVSWEYYENWGWQGKEKKNKK